MHCFITLQEPWSHDIGNLTQFRHYLNNIQKGVKEAFHTSDQINQVFHTPNKIPIKVLKHVHTSETI